jgi:hypothetical protein
MISVLNAFYSNVIEKHRTLGACQKNDILEISRVLQPSPHSDGRDEMPSSTKYVEKNISTISCTEFFTYCKAGQLAGVSVYFLLSLL